MAVELQKCDYTLLQDVSASKPLTHPRVSSIVFHTLGITILITQVVIDIIGMYCYYSGCRNLEDDSCKGICNPSVLTSLSFPWMSTIIPAMGYTTILFFNQ